MKGRLIFFLLVIFVMLLCSCEKNNKTQEYTLHYSGDNVGIITIKKDFFKKITITPKMSKSDGEIELDNERCSLLPKNKYYFIDIYTKNITINGNTTTKTTSFGSWSKIVVNGNTTIETYSNGDWEKTVVEGDTTTQTKPNGNWVKTVKNGNTITETFFYHRRKKLVTIVTIVEGNTITKTSSSGWQSKTVVDKQGYNIYIFEERNEFLPENESTDDSENNENKLFSDDLKPETIKTIPELPYDDYEPNPWYNLYGYNILIDMKDIGL